MRPYELIAPDWMDELHFNIQATLPSGAVREQVPEMLQALLSARFQLATDLERREMPAYALVRGKDDPRLTPAAESAPDAGGMRCFVTIGETRVCAGENGRIELFERLAARVELHALRGQLRRDFDADDIRRSQTAAVHIDVARITMADLAYELGPIMGRPVFDRTGLSGEFQVSFDLPEGTFQPPIESSPDTLPVFEGRGALGRSLEWHGLTWESRRMLVDVIVVKSISRSPTPN